MNKLMKRILHRKFVVQSLKRYSSVDYTYKNYDVQRKEFSKVTFIFVDFLNSVFLFLFSFIMILIEIRC